MGTATISFLSAKCLGTATCIIASEMTSRELAVVLEKLAKIEHKQDEYQSNFLSSSGVNKNADASAFVSGTSSGKGQKELLEELLRSITAIKAAIKDLAKQIEEKEWMILSSMEGATASFYMNVLTFPKKMQVMQLLKILC